MVSAYVHDHAANDPHPKDEPKVFDFPKRYDARPDLNGMKKAKCELGQLVSAGHTQHQ